MPVFVVLCSCPDAEGAETLAAALVAARLAAGMSTIAAARPVDESNLLPVDQAFVLASRATDHADLQLTWKIAPGYYLYRERISAKADAAFQAGTLQLPAGIPKHDPF